MNIYYHGARREIIVSKDQSKFPSKCKLLEIEQVRYKLPIPIWKHLYFVFFRKRRRIHGICSSNCRTFISPLWIIQIWFSLFLLRKTKSQARFQPIIHFASWSKRHGCLNSADLFDFHSITLCFHF